MLRRLNDDLFDPKSERMKIESPLSVEHILPQDWLEWWPLPDGSTGMSQQELAFSTAADPRIEASRLRHSAVQTMGNLTLLTQELNSAVSNREWAAKRDAILETSLLPLNQPLRGVESWDERAIRSRAEGLFGRALVLWPRIASGT
jgi:uncharacterized protein YqcC (DUF446 family)